MELENVKNLTTNKILKKKIEEINKLKEKDNYEEAYNELKGIIDILNHNFINKYLKINIEDSEPELIEKIYWEKERNLLSKMVNIHQEYKLSNNVGIHMDDLEFLALYIDDIYKYMLENYGEVI